MQAISGTSWKATTLSSDTADISNDDKSVCVICQVEFDKKIVVDSYGHAFHSDQRQCDKCIGVRKITSATQAKLEAAIRDGNFSLAQRLVNDHGAILTADILKVGLESAAKTLNVQQARNDENEVGNDENEVGNDGSQLVLTLESKEPKSMGTRVLRHTRMAN